MSIMHKPNAEIAAIVSAAAKRKRKAKKRWRDALRSAFGKPPPRQRPAPIMHKHKTPH